MKYVLLLILLTTCGYDSIYQGRRGVAGKDGSSCVVESIDGGARIVCEDGSEVLIYHGSVGADGESIEGPQGIPGDSVVIVCHKKHCHVKD